MKKDESRYATVTDDDGGNYREIASVMTELGFKMNHSSARNYVLRIMKRFAEEYSREFGASMTDCRLLQIAKDPMFQSTIAELLQTIELDRRRTIKR